MLQFGFTWLRFFQAYGNNVSNTSAYNFDMFYSDSTVTDEGLGVYVGFLQVLRYPHQSKNVH